MFQLLFVMIPAFVGDVYNKCTILNSTSLLSCLFPGGRYMKNGRVVCHETQHAKYDLRTRRLNRSPNPRPSPRAGEAKLSIST